MKGILDVDSLLYKATFGLSDSAWKVSSENGVWYTKTRSEAEDIGASISNFNDEDWWSITSANDDELFKAICDRYLFLIEHSFKNCEFAICDLIDERIVVISDPNPCYWRTVIYPEYKASRKKKQSPRFMKKLKEFAVSRDDVTVTAPFLEADDLVCALGNKFKGECVVLGIDKDLLQIPGLHFNYNTLNLMYVSGFETVYNLMFQCIQGDVADNIKGLKGCGKVKATNTLSGCTTCFQLYARTRDLYKEVVGEEYREHFKLTYSLLRLCRNEIELKEERVQ